MSIETAEALFKKYDGHINLLRKNEPSSYAIISAACLSDDCYEEWRKEILDGITQMGVSDIFNITWFIRFVSVFKEMNRNETYRFDCLVDLLRAYVKSNDSCKIEVLRKMVGNVRFGYRDGLLYWVLRNTSGFSVVEAIMQQNYVNTGSDNPSLLALSEQYKKAVYKYV